MEYLVRNIAIPVMEITRENELSLIREKAARLIRIPPRDLRDFKIIKESVDSRRKKSIQMVYTLLVSLDGNISAGKDIIPYQREKELPVKNGTPMTAPVIVGAGPCGLFCAWELVERGFLPIILERGEEVEKRAVSVEGFWKQGVLNPDSNVQFGEGGAGTFSDGKLTTRINDPRCEKILKILTRFGAPEEILYKAKAHIGTDILRVVVRNIREALKSAGCKFYFSTKMESLIVSNKKVCGVKLSDGSKIDTRAVVLAIGHSARDTFHTILSQGVEIIQKSFSVGVRIEHLQESINSAQYGDIRHFKLGAADYQLFEHLKDHTAYTFCMCPGGIVVASASEEESVVTNGMSYHSRDMKNANSAYVVSVGTSDFGSSYPLAGVDFQRKLERACFNKDTRYAAPVQKLSDFIDGIPGRKPGIIKPSYTGEVYYTDLNKILPGFVSHSIKASAGAFDRKLKGFMNPDAMMTAPETRTSSPIRITRGENMQSVSVEGLFPAGEGAGYAGGIMSSAVDGLRIAERLSADFSR